LWVSIGVGVGVGVGADVDVGAAATTATAAAAAATATATTATTAATATQVTTVARSSRPSFKNIIINIFFSLLLLQLPFFKQCSAILWSFVFTATNASKSLALSFTDSLFFSYYSRASSLGGCRWFSCGFV
jgi:hypothetical protein